MTRFFRAQRLCCAIIAIALTAFRGPVGAAEDLRVSPATVLLHGPESSQQLLVASGTLGKASVDLTRRVQYESADLRVAAIDETGLIMPLADGKTEVRIRSGPTLVVVPIEVRGVDRPAPVSFEHQMIPLFTKAGCNAGGCHGKAEGQNGFRLSVFGFDPAGDYDAIVSEGRGRRVFLPVAERSLLVRKASAEIPHGGGRKVPKETPQYRRLVRWVREGCPRVADPSESVVALEVEPAEHVLPFRGTQQLRVTAVTAGGQRKCVTAEAEYDSNATTIAGVDRRGWVQASDVPGEAAILVRYLGNVAVARMTIPRPGLAFPRPSEANFIDRHVWDKLERLGIPPSEPADDATYLRRVFLDTIGTLPSATEARAFLANTDPDKRAKLIDTLLDRPEYADYWAMKWSDLLRVDRDAINAEGGVAVTRWLRKQFAANVPYDRFVRAVICALGPVSSEGPAAFYKVLNTPEVMSRSISQLFLGVRIECAQCHHHPSERWGQDDYFALAGFFTGVQRKQLPAGGESIVVRTATDLKHPRSGKIIAARALGAAAPDFADSLDRRAVLADWMTADQNPYLARAFANRLWAHYFGRGIVEPLDDLRSTNPASNEPLLDALAAHLREVRYDIKRFTKTLLTSRVYQLASKSNDGNARDDHNFSHSMARTLPAEVLLDAICQVTGVPEKFVGWPLGFRSIQVWDNRMPSYFFQIFGRPVRASVCECERSTEPSIAQALHLMNSPELMAKLHDRDGVPRRLAESSLSPRELIDELYLSTLCRHPDENEYSLMLEAFSGQGSDRRAAIEDVLWMLVNSKEFLYNH